MKILPCNYSANFTGNLDKYKEKYKHSYVSDIVPDLQEYIAKTGRLCENDIIGVAGHGGLSLIFNLKDGNVLKCSLENPLEYRTHNPSLDIPFLSPVEKQNKTYIVKEVKAETENLTTNDVQAVRNRIFKVGLEPSQDFSILRADQIGKYQGKTYLLDTRCACPKPNRFSRFIYDFKAYNSKVFKPTNISIRQGAEAKLLRLFGPKYLHADETPRPNLSFRRGMAIIRGVMKRNMKYGQSPISIMGISECILKLITR